MIELLSDKPKTRMPIWSLTTKDRLCGLSFWFMCLPLSTSPKCISNNSSEKKNNLLHFCGISVLIKLIWIIWINIKKGKAFHGLLLSVKLAYFLISILVANENGSSINSKQCGTVINHNETDTRKLTFCDWFDIRIPTKNSWISLASKISKWL